MGKPYGSHVTNCPKCNASIGDAHPYAWCSECGEPLGKDVLSQIPSQVAAAQASASMSTTKPQGESGQTSPRSEYRGSLSACLTLGLFCLGVGFYFLLVNPSEEIGGDYVAIQGSRVANIHRLTLGETFSIMGTIFLAVGLRPRE